MEKHYKVAGHIFSISFKDTETAKLLTNYAPFETDECDSSIFDMELVEGLVESEKESYYTTPDDADEPRLDLFKTEEGWWVEMAPTGKMKQIAQLRTGADFRHGKLNVSEKKYTRFAIDNAAMLLYAFRTSCLNTLEMHSSVVRYHGKAYMFLAASGTGKSTHSRMWQENLEGVELMNDDNPIVRIEDGKVTCYGSPWSGKTPCYRNVSAPVGAMVEIFRAKENKAERLGILEAYALVNSSSSGLRALENMADGLHESTSAIVKSVPIFRMNCLPDGEAALVCCKAVNGNVLKKGPETIPNEILLPEVSRLLDEGKEVELMTKGCSMLPFIRGDRDSVVLRKKSDIAVGDIVLANIGNTFVLHRIFAIEGEKVTLMGDGNIKGKEHCLKKNICGTVEKIIKPEKEVTPTRGRLWRAVRPLRRYILFIYRRFI